MIENKNSDPYGKVFGLTFALSILSIILMVILIIVNEALLSGSLSQFRVFAIIWFILSVLGFFISPIIIAAKSNDDGLKSAVAGVFETGMHDRDE